MAFEVADVRDLLRVLRENPEWREAVRQEVLGDELLTLPDLVRELAEQTRENSRQIAELRATTEELRATTEALRATTEELRASIEGIRTAMREEFQRVDSAIRALTEEVRTLSREVRRGAGRTGSLEGEVTEFRWWRNFAGRFGAIIYRAKLVTPRELERFEDAFEAGTIAEDEALAVRNLDLMIEGTMGRGKEAREVVLAVEVSTTVERHDVDRAVARAATLRKVGYDAVPAVAGARMDATLRDDAVAQGVQVVLRPEDVHELPEIEP